jgi:hypothetical protein
MFLLLLLSTFLAKTRAERERERERGGGEGEEGRERIVTYFETWAS